MTSVEAKITIEYDGRRYDLIGDIHDDEPLELSLDRPIEHHDAGLDLPPIIGPMTVTLRAVLYKGERDAVSTYTVVPPAPGLPPVRPIARMRHIEEDVRDHPEWFS